MNRENIEGDQREILLRSQKKEEKPLKETEGHKEKLGGNVTRRSKEPEEGRRTEQEATNSVIVAEFQNDKLLKKIVIRFGNVGVAGDWERAILAEGLVAGARLEVMEFRDMSCQYLAR